MRKTLVCLLLSTLMLLTILPVTAFADDQNTNPTPAPGQGGSQEGTHAQSETSSKPKETAKPMNGDRKADLEGKTIWDNSVAAAKLTGDKAQDLVAVARTQLGYLASMKNYIVTEEGRKKPYTRYGAWTGYPYADWCAAFVAFCLHYAHVDLPVGIGSQSYQSTLQDKGLYREKEGYEPQAGDLIFFGMGGSPVANHIGIVIEVSGDIITTIEGNHTNKVETFTYEKNNKTILGYGKLPQDADDPDAARKDQVSETEQAELELIEQEIHDDQGIVMISGLLPAGATVTVRQLTPDEIAALELRNQELVFAYDITIRVDGKKYQPRGVVGVVIRDSNITEDVSVKHVLTDENDTIRGQETIRSYVENERVSFETDGFSIYFGVRPIISSGSYQVGDILYATLQEAIVAVGEGEIIELTEDAEEPKPVPVDNGKRFTLDLKGKELSLIGFDPDGTIDITIIDTDDGGKLSLTKEGGYSGIAPGTEKTVCLTVNSGTIESAGLLLYTMGRGSSVTITGGTVLCAGVSVDSRGQGAISGEGITSVNIEGGILTVTDDGMAIRARNADVNISGGTLTAAEEVIREAKSVAISGGTFSGNGTSATGTPEIHGNVPIDRTQGQESITGGSFRHDVTAFLNANNYACMLQDEQTFFTVFPKNVVVTSASQDWTYDGREHVKHEYTVTYGSESFLVTVPEDETSGFATLSTGDTVTITPDASSVVKDYDANYRENNTFSCVLTNEENYSGVSTIAGTVSINKRPVTFTGETDTAGYTGSLIQLTTIQISSGANEGLVNGHTSNVTYLASGTEAGGPYIGVITPKEKVSIVADGTDVTRNYDITTAAGALIITPTTSRFTIALADHASTYDAQQHHNTNMVSSTAMTGATTYRYSFRRDGSYVDDLADLEQVDAGEYTIYVKATNPNYASEAETTAKLSIAKAPLTVTARPRTYTYTGADQGPSGTFTEELDDYVMMTGLQGADVLSSVTLHGQAKEVGEYDGMIVPSEAAVGTATENYEITYEPGKLTIRKSSQNSTAATGGSARSPLWDIILIVSAIGCSIALLIAYWKKMRG